MAIENSKSVINVGKPIKLNAKSPDLDQRYGPYESLDAAIVELGSGETGADVLCTGLTIGILQKDEDGVVTGLKEYWYINGKFTEKVTYNAVYQADIEARADQAAAIAELVGENDLYAGDIVVLRELIATDITSRQYTAYVYDGEKFTAMDGNYSAENVILSSDITLAGNYTQVGNLTKASSTATTTWAVKGKSVQEAFTELFTKRLQPTITSQPTVTVTLSNAGAKEVGTSFTAQWSASLSSGSYTYGPDTGITASSWTIQDTLNPTSTAESGSFGLIQVTDNMTYTITATAVYGAGRVAFDNLGATSDPRIQIDAGSKSAESGSVTGYRAFFYGGLTEKVDITSDNIRNLTNGGSFKSSFIMSIPEGTKQVIIALPTERTITKVADQNAFSTDILSAFTKSTCAVAGANGYTAINYTIYEYLPDVALAADTYTITCN